MKKPRQMDLRFRTWGGKRKNAGRKPSGERPCVSHAARPSLSAHVPLHVTIRLREGLPTLRQERLLNEVRAVLAKAKERFGLRIVHYSIQSNHLHLVVEAADRRALSRGMRGFDIRLGRGVNRVLGLRGPVLGDRYHARVLKTPREVRNVLVYVLQNWRHHSRAAQAGWDLASSAVVFDGWLDADPRKDVERAILDLVAATRAPPERCWLLKHGWKRRGLIRTTEAPR